MNQKAVEFIVGLFVIFAAILLLFLALKVSGFSHHEASAGYQLEAEFDNIGSLKVGAPVNVAGVKIGEVGAIDLDPQTFRAEVKINIFSKDTKLPTDSTASVFTEGILGAQYVAITPGYASTELQNKDQIQITHSALILENLIGQLVFNMKK